MSGAFLGPSFAQSDIEHDFHGGCTFAVLSEDEMIKTTGGGPVAGESAWDGSRGEWSLVRAALGAVRFWVILVRRPCRKKLNLKVKYREIIPAVCAVGPARSVSDWFEIDSDSPYMLLVADVRKARRREMTTEENQLFGIDKLNVPRSDIPAVTHVDYSARIQTVMGTPIRLYHALLYGF